MRKSRSPTNTTKVMESDAGRFGFLAEAMGGGTSTAIERQEARGQRELVNSDTLPTKMDDADRQTLKSLGVTFKGGVPDDKLFQYAELPKGWQRKATDHSMWSDLVDGSGKVIAKIFYKAAFYDRDAFLRVVKPS